MCVVLVATRAEARARAQTSCLILRLSEEVRSKYGITEVNFTAGKFDTGPSNFKSNTMEDHIVTSTGPWIISWNFRLLKSDYEKSRNRDQMDTTVVPRIAFQQQTILDNQFEYGGIRARSFVRSFPRPSPFFCLSLCLCLTPPQTATWSSQPPPRSSAALLSPSSSALVLA